MDIKDDKSSANYIIELLSRLDERTKNLTVTLDNSVQSFQIQTQQINERLNAIEKSNTSNIRELETSMSVKFRELETDIEENYVSKASFAPIKTFVYGLIGLALTAVGLVIIGSALKGVPS